MSAATHSSVVGARLELVVEAVDGRVGVALPVVLAARHKLASVSATAIAVERHPKSEAS